MSCVSVSINIKQTVKTLALKADDMRKARFHAFSPPEAYRPRFLIMLYMYILLYSVYIFFFFC